MTNEEKIQKLKELLTNINDISCLETLQSIDALKNHYSEYMTTSPINCDQELKRLNSADFDLCAALLTMLLREDHFTCGSLGRRLSSGQVEAIILRMIDLLQEGNESAQQNCLDSILSSDR